MHNAHRPIEPLLICIGTRPEIIKMAPVCRALREQGVPFRLLHTGQHDELAEPLYAALGLEPDARLDLHRGAGSLAELSATLLSAIDPAIVHWDPSALVVHGDTSSAAMAALAAYYRGIPVAHVEAGLRSHVWRDPFPEEFNRSLIARLAAWHFAPTPVAVENLLREGIAPRAIHVVGNTIVEATQQALDAVGARRKNGAASPASPASPAEPAPGGAIRASDVLGRRRLIAVTAHRRENWGAPIQGLVRALAALLQAHDDLLVVWPVHANPVLGAQIRQEHARLAGAVAERLVLSTPLDYLQMIALMDMAWLVLTDSGGIQEEACALGLPVLVLRETTERPELIAAGAGRLVGTDPVRVAAEVERLWRSPKEHLAMRSGSNPFGDGQASARIARTLSSWLNGEREPAARTAAAHARGGASSSPHAIRSLKRHEPRAELR